MLEPRNSRVRLMQGNEACAEGALAAGLTFYAGYPITPATEIAELLSRKLPQRGGSFIQMEDEIACMAAIIGASIAGAKTMTATSGPGFSLMQENLGYAVMAEVPCVIVDVQRGGPSTGLATAPSQADVMQARWGSHGDRPIIALSPASVKEMFDLTVECFNLAERYRVPVILLTDAIIAHVREKVLLPDPAEICLFNRKKPSVGPEDYKPYRPDEDGVPPMACFGEGYRYSISGVVHNETGTADTKNPKVASGLINRLHEKIEKNRSSIIKYEADFVDDAEIIVLAYGCVARSSRQAVVEAREHGVKAGFFRPITLWPFPEEELLRCLGQAHTIIVPEMNRGQYAGEVSRALADAGLCLKVARLMELGSRLITPEEINNKIMEVAANA